MLMLEQLIRKEMKKKGYSKEEAEGLKKSEILKEMDADTVQLIALIPQKTMDSIWCALGVEDG